MPAYYQGQSFRLKLEMPKAKAVKIDGVASGAARKNKIL